MTVQRYGGFAAVARLDHWERAGLAGALVAGCLTAVGAAVLPAAAQRASLALRARCITYYHVQHCGGSAGGRPGLLLMVSAEL